VLVTYAHAGEIIQQGQPLYRIAGLDTLILRAYVTGDQLASFRLGQRVDVRFDGEQGLRAIPGTVQWISDKAEFTPTPVQTRDDRATLVYAMKVRVPNADGRLKIGMPGDVTLSPAATAQVP
jgi:HlyD family secretion protein